MTSAFSSTTSGLDAGGSSGSGGSGGAPNFTFLPGAPLATDPIQFDGDDAATSWTWDFGDGVGTSSLEDPVYTYPTSGTYTVLLTTDLSSYAVEIEVGEPGPCSGPLATNEFFDWEAGEELIENPWDPTPQTMLARSNFYGGADGTSWGGTFGNEPVGSRGIKVCAPGATFSFTGYSAGYGDSWNCTPFGVVNWSWGVKWYDAADTLLQTDVVADNQGPQDGPFQLDTAQLTAPAGTAYLRLAQRVSAAGCQPNNTHMDEVSISLIAAP